MLGYCYFHSQDYVNAANCYEQLTMLLPDEPEYKLYLAQALYQGSLYEEAVTVAAQIESPDFAPQVRTLKVDLSNLTSVDF